ncbi:hypothetical protein EXE42_15705, partial [Halorubrum sp. SP3]
MGTRDNENDTAVDADTFQQWVKHTAESRGMTEHELLNQLVSAFWALDEMGDIALDSASAPGNTASEKDQDWNPPRGRPTENDAPSETETPGSNEASTPNSSDSESGDRISPDDLDPRDDLSPTEVELTRRVAEMRRQVADLSLDVEQQRSRQEEFTDRLSDDVTRLHSEIQSLESRVDQDDGDLANRIDSVEARLEDVEETQAEFETWIDEEFDQIEALFSQILDTVREFDGRVTDLSSSVDTMVDAKQDREALDTLRKQAVRKGIDTGRCENCDMTVDLSMLSEASCPSCDKQFRDIEASTPWNPFSKPTLRTNGRPSP